MNELINLNLTPDKEDDNQDVIKLIEKLCKDNEEFKQFLTNLVNKYIELVDERTIVNNSQLIKKYDQVIKKLDDVTHHVSVNLDYDWQLEGLTLK